MALTMTRIRTQATLTRLTRVFANLNGELEFVGRLSMQMPEQSDALAVRRQTLLLDREALVSTLKLFDPEMDVAGIGSVADWRRAYGRSAQLLVQRYVKCHAGSVALKAKRVE